MPDQAPTPIPSGDQDSIHVLRYYERQAHDAWDAYRAVCMQEKRNPALLDNPAWLALRQDAYAAFAGAFQALMP